MKTHSAILALAVAMSIPSTAPAQHARFSVGAGLMAPSGDYWSRPDYFGHLTHVPDAGWQLMGAVEFSVPRTPMGLRVDGIHGEIVIGEGFRDSRHKLNGGFASLVYHIGTPMAPLRFYLLAGAGYISAKSNSPVFAQSELKPAFGGGTGLTLGAGPLTPFVEGRFIRFLANGTPMTFFPVTVGLSHAL